MKCCEDYVRLDDVAQWLEQYAIEEYMVNGAALPGYFALWTAAGKLREMNNDGTSAHD